MRRRPGRKKTAAPSPAPEAEDLFSALRAVRSRLAQEENVPAYVVFSNATLADMAEKAPRTMDEFLDVTGLEKSRPPGTGRNFSGPSQSIRTRSAHRTPLVPMPVGRSGSPDHRRSPGTAPPSNSSEKGMTSGGCSGWAPRIFSIQIMSYHRPNL